MRQASRDITNNGSYKTTSLPSRSVGSAGRFSFIVLILVVVAVLTMTQQPLEKDIEFLNTLLSDAAKLTVTAPQGAFSSASSTSKHLRLQQQRSSDKFPTAACPETFDVNMKELKELSGGVSDPNEGVFHARRTTTNPEFWISLHQQSFDSLRWEIMTHGNYYEKKQTEAFVKILQQESTASPLHFVDVGGNIGWFSLVSVAAAVAADRAIVVDVFEPNPRNRYRMCQSLQLNKWLNHDLVDFNLYPLGVSSASGGIVQMSIADSGIGKLGRLSDVNEKDNIDIHLVSLDDMAKEFDWKKNPVSILKVDVEGLELEVFEGATSLLQSGQVENIFFEGNARSDEEIEKFRNIIQLLAKSGYYAYMHGGWHGPDRLVATKPVQSSQVGNEEELNTYTTGIMTECSSNKMDSKYHKNAQCNLWWRKATDKSSLSS